MMTKIFGFVAALFIATPAMAEDSRYAMFYDMGYVYALSDYCDFASLWRSEVRDMELTPKEGNTFFEGYSNGVDSINNSGATGPFCVASYDLYWRVFGGH